MRTAHPVHQETTALKKKIVFKNQNLIYYDNERNSSVILFFCHANGYSGRCYNYYLKRLGKSHRVLAVDLINHGRSGSDTAFRNWSFYSDQIAGIILHEDLDNIVGIGHSMGGPILVGTAQKNHGRFRGLIGLDPTFLNMAKIVGTRLFGNPLSWRAKKRRSSFKNTSILGKNEKSLESVFKRHQLTRTWHPEIIQDYLGSCYIETQKEVLLCCDPKTESKNFRTPSYGVILQASSLKIPFYLILPENSKVCSTRMARRVTQNHPKSGITTKEGIGHHFPFESPDWTLNEIKKILKEF